MSRFSFMPADGGITEVFMRRMDIFGPICAGLQRAIREDPSPLSVVDRELVATVTSAANACLFCTNSHAAFTISVGGDREVVEACVRDIETAPIRPELRAILRYCQKLTRAPASVTNEDKDAVIAAGATEEELSHAITICAMFNMFNRIVEGHGVRGSPIDHYLPVAEHIRAHGYGGASRARTEAAEAGAADALAAGTAAGEAEAK